MNVDPKIEKAADIIEEATEKAAEYIEDGDQRRAQQELAKAWRALKTIEDGFGRMLGDWEYWLQSGEDAVRAMSNEYWDAG